MKKIIITLLISMLLCTGCQGNPKVTASPTTNPDPERTNVKNNAKIIVYKSERKLEVYDDDKKVATMKISLGFTPKGHKQHEGDGKTPEGEYYICTRNERSRYFLSVGLSYPNIDDATAGLERGHISQDEFNKIKKSIEAGERPPWNTALGGEIMIHGKGSSSDWTAGCIALTDNDMQYVWDNCDIGTPVTIKP
jgi:murein L,D-transpeptidase YafK